jgi:hypothetical protein
MPAMGRALVEAWRVLRKDGTLINLQPSLYQPFRNGTVSYLIQGQFGTTVDDERYRQARMALKYASLIEGRFKLLSEEEFALNTYYDTVGEALKSLTADHREEYKALPGPEKARVKEAVGLLKARKGVKVEENVVLTVLSKTHPGDMLATPRT